MRKILVGVALTALLSVSSATASPPQGKGKPTTGTGCRPMVTVMLYGTLTTDPGPTAPALFKMDVKGTNKHGKSLKGLNVQISVDANTKIRHQGSKLLDSLAVGDRALVQIRRCKGELPLTTDTVDDFAASRVIARAATKATATTNDDTSLTQQHGTEGAGDNSKGNGKGKSGK